MHKKPYALVNRNVEIMRQIVETKIKIHNYKIKSLNYDSEKFDKS